MRDGRPETDTARPACGSRSCGTGGADGLLGTERGARCALGSSHFHVTDHQELRRRLPRGRPRPQQSPLLLLLPGELALQSLTSALERELLPLQPLQAPRLSAAEKQSHRGQGFRETDQEGGGEGSRGWRGKRCHSPRHRLAEGLTLTGRWQDAPPRTHPSPPGTGSGNHEGSQRQGLKTDLLQGGEGRQR